MKLKKYKDFILLKEGKEEFVNVDGVKFYHGTVGFEIESIKDLNPLFRQTDEYKKIQDDPQRKGRSASSESGTGIYFGRDFDKMGPEDSGQFFHPNMARSPEITRGFMYEMTLKSNSKVVVSSDWYGCVSEEEYKKLRSEGIDAISEHPINYKNGGGLVLLNTDAIQTWKEIKRWERPFNVKLLKENPEVSKADTEWKPGDIVPEAFIEVESKQFFNFNEVEEYVKKHLGDVKVPYEGDVYSKDDKNCVEIVRPDVVYK